MTSRVRACGPHGIPSYTDDAGTVHVATGGRCAGPTVVMDTIGGRRPHPTCIETTNHAEVVAGKRSWICGQDCPVVIPPDDARDARVAERRRADARKAAIALDRLLADTWTDRTTGRAYFEKGYSEGFHDGWSDGYAASEEHHKSHYGVSTQPEPDRSVNFYRCLGCSFVTASADSVVEHVNATGHMIEGNG